MGRSYKTRKEVLKELEDIFLELRRSGAEFFPSERKLAKMVGASRETLRRSLELLEEKQLLIKGFQSRILSTKKKNGLDVVFLTQGIENILSPTWSRLWILLSKMAENASFNLKSSFLNRNSSESIFSEFSKKPPDVIIFSDFPDNTTRDCLFKLKGKSILVAVDENHKDKCDYCVCLDNFAVGECAAEALIKAGYKKPVFIGGDFPQYKPFRMRAEGFVSKLKANGINLDDSDIRWLPAGGRTRRIRSLIHLLESMSSEKYDSMFLYSDEHVAFVYEILDEFYNIPGEYGLISAVGSELSLHHNPVITAISHCDEQTARSLVELIEKISIGKKKIQRKRLIKPELIKGETIHES